MFLFWLLCCFGFALVVPALSRFELFDQWIMVGWGGGRFITHRLTRCWERGRIKFMYRGYRFESVVSVLPQGCDSRG